MEMLQLPQVWACVGTTEGKISHAWAGGFRGQKWIVENQRGFLWQAQGMERPPPQW